MRRVRASVGGGSRLMPAHLPRKLLVSTGLGLAQHAGYLARIPAVGTLAAETVLGASILLGKRFLGLRLPPIMDDIAEVALIVATNRAGSRGLAALTGTRAVSGTDIGAGDPYAVEGVDDYVP